ncbi:MAG: hypothetical protein BGN88_01455 [Clostridiales bacterium 43-6]|nr:MAG: hypothetical protein BGN88_01455 [Clostridiales bacterium 43-6]
MFEETNQTSIAQSMEGEGNVDGYREDIDLIDTVDSGEDDDVENDEIEDCGDDLFSEDGEQNQAELAEAEENPPFQLSDLEIVYNGKTTKLTEYPPEVIRTNFQKGLNYDHIKTENAALKASPAISLLQGAANMNGMPLNAYMESLQNDVDTMEYESMLQQGFSSEDAYGIVQSKRKEQNERMQNALHEMEKTEQTQKMYLSFVQRFPDVKPEEIPGQVWERHLQGEDLVGAYLDYQNRQLSEKLQMVHQNKESRKRAMGSALTDGPNHSDGFLSALFG